MQTRIDFCASSSLGFLHALLTVLKPHTAKFRKAGLIGHGISWARGYLSANTRPGLLHEFISALFRRWITLHSWKSGLSWLSCACFRPSRRPGCSTQQHATKARKDLSSSRRSSPRGFSSHSRVISHPEQQQQSQHHGKKPGGHTSQHDGAFKFRKT